MSASPPNNPFDRSHDADQPPKRSNTWLWVFGILGGVFVAGALVCCGGSYFLFQAGKSVLAETLKTELRGNAVVQEHLGAIETVEVNLTATAREDQNSEGPQVMVFDVTGTEGSGQVAVRPDGRNGFSSAELILPDGTRHPIDLASPDDEAPVEPTEIDEPNTPDSADTPPSADADPVADEAEQPEAATP